jgi:hypothetical protein
LPHNRSTVCHSIFWRRSIGIRVRNNQRWFKKYSVSSSSVVERDALQRATAANGSEAGGGATTEVAFQAVAAAKGSEVGGGSKVGADVTNAQEPGIPL